MILDHATGTRTAFRDRELQRHYDQEGYAVVPFLGRSEVDALVEVANSNYGGAAGFISSSTDPDREKRRHLADIVIDICAPAIERSTIDHRVMMGGFLIKPPQDPQVYFEPHVDWSLVDERTENAFQVWMPLADTDVASGGLFILPRSYKLIDTPRGSPHRFAHSLDQLNPEQIMKYGRFMSMRAGDALLMDPRTVHWSPPNTTAEPRIAIVLGIVPEDAQLRHYYARPDGAVHAYAVDDEFFRTFDTGDVPQGRRLEQVDVDPHHVDEETVRRVCAPDMALGPRKLTDESGAQPSPLSFREADTQRVFENEGFATFRLLSPAQLETLAEVRDEARRRASGYYDSGLDEADDFRSRASKLIVDLCAAQVEEVFADAEILTGSLLVKVPEIPGASSLRA